MVLKLIKLKNELIEHIIPLFGVLLLSYLSYTNFTPYVYVVFIIGLLSFIISYEFGVKFFIILVLISSDISFDVGLEDSVGLSSIFTTSIGPLNISVIWTLSVFIILNFRTLKYGKLDKFTYYYLLFIIFHVVIGFQNIVIPGNRWISDFAYLLNILVGVNVINYLFSKYYEGNFDFKVKRDIVFLTYLFACKMLAQVLHAIYTLNVNSLTNYLSESGLYLSCIFIPLVIFFKKEYNSIFIYYFCLAMPILANFISAARGRFIVLILTLVMILILTKKIKSIVNISFITIFALVFVSIYAPNYFDFFLWKVGSFEIDGGTSQSSTVRYIEFKNIVSEHFKYIYSFFLGSGIGSYFTSESFPFPFSLYGTGSYPDLWIQNDTFFKPHGSWQFIFLKFGLLGLFLFFIYFPYVAWKKRSRCGSGSIENNVLSIVLVSIIPLFMVNFTSKLQLFTGLVVGIIIYLRESK